MSARLMSLADEHDALISRRVCKPAFSFGPAPDIVDAFVAVEPRCHEFAGHSADSAKG